MKRSLSFALFLSLSSLAVHSALAQPANTISGELLLMPETISSATKEEQPSKANSNATTSQSVSNPLAATEPQLRIAFILPEKGSRFDAVTQYALDGLLAANYASANPAEVLLIRPGNNGTVEDELIKAAHAGAMVAIGPLERNAVDTISQLPFLPLPVVTLNQVELNTQIPLTEEEIQAKKIDEEARKMADQALRELNHMTSTAENGQAKEVDSNANSEITPSEEQPTSGAISSQTRVPGLVYAKDLEEKYVRYEPRVFPRGLLMMGLSMESDAQFIADIGIQALPRLTDSGERPKVLVLDQDSPLEKRISETFQKALTEGGFAPDRLTVQLSELQRISQFFDLVVDENDPEIDPEELIDQEVDPAGWRQQQLRLRREESEKRALATFAEPPYYAVFMALDANTASQIRPRLPIRTRVWGTSSVYPGNPDTSSSAKALTFDLKQVGFVDCPFILDFNQDAFEEKYKVPAPEGLVQKRLFALGADAFEIATSVARGEISKEVKGLTGTLNYDLETSPIVTRQGQTAMITNGGIRIMDIPGLVNYQIIPHGMKNLKVNITGTTTDVEDTNTDTLDLFNHEPPLPGQAINSAEKQQ